MGPFIKQAWTASAVLVNLAGLGMAFSFPTSLMPALMAKDAEIPADLTTASWIASSIGIGSIPGFFISSYCMDRFGRRTAHELTALPAVIGWLCIYFATDTTWLLIGRLFSGLFTGAITGLSAVVLGEYTSPKHRGMFLHLKSAALYVGGTIGHIIGNFCSWRTVALFSLIPHIVTILLTATWPESPAWLVKNGEFEDGKKSFFWLRGKDENSMDEIKKMIHAQSKQVKYSEKEAGQKMMCFLKMFTQKDFLKPVFILFLGTSLLEVSGRHYFPSYALDIVGEITGSQKKSFYFTLGLDLIITTSIIFSSILVKLMKRRVLLFTTGFASVAVLAVACIYLFLVSEEVISKDHPWIPMGLFIIFFILTNLGCTPLPLTFFGELLPLAHRGVGTAVGGIGMSLLMYLLLQLTPLLLVNCKVYGTFAILGALMAMLLSILYFVLPETKDRTLQDIEDFFNGRQSKDEDVKKKMIDEKDGDVKVKMFSKPDKIEDDDVY